jgi:hypothetical protein
VTLTSDYSLGSICKQTAFEGKTVILPVIVLCITLYIPLLSSILSRQWQNISATVTFFLEFPKPQILSSTRKSKKLKKVKETPENL